MIVLKSLREWEESNLKINKWVIYLHFTLQAKFSKTSNAIKYFQALGTMRTENIQIQAKQLQI